MGSAMGWGGVEVGWGGGSPERAGMFTPVPVSTRNSSEFQQRFPLLGKSRFVVYHSNSSPPPHLSPPPQTLGVNPWYFTVTAVTRSRCHLINHTPSNGPWFYYLSCKKIWVPYLAICSRNDPWWLEPWSHQLLSLNSHKASDPDGLKDRTLKNYEAHQLRFTLIVQLFLDSYFILRAGRLPQ